MSTSGHQLLPGAAVSYLITHLLPLTYILTPNLPEARLLLESSNSSVPSEIDNIHDAIEIARALHKLGPKYILLKGGHSPYKKVGKYDYWCAKTEEEREVIVDVLFDGNEAVLIASPYIHSQNTHGTGCSLACTHRLTHTIGSHH